ncbi:MAG: DegQ family serine endoprotease [candidate division WOR-3 bacterium]
MSNHKPLSYHIRVGVLIAIAVVFAFVLGLFVAGSFNFRSRNTLEAQAKPQISEPKYTVITEEGTSPFVKVAEMVIPTVVNISAEKVIKTRSRDFWWPFDDDWFKEFFKNLPKIEPETEKRQTLGSGVIISEDGYIITNNHVIADYDNIVVRLYDKTEYKGKKVKVVGRDPKTDVAVLKIDVGDRKLPVAKLGNSDEIKVGDWAIAVGIPFGLEGTVTVGVISAKGRSNIPLPEISYQDFIQTDASINPGNSGGPLVNIRGEVIGINTAIRSPVGANVGIGFATPINLVKEIAETLIKKGKIVRGYLGVYPQEISQDLKEALGLPSTEGVLISEVVENTPAAKAGLKPGDVIVRFNGVKVKDVSQFRRMVAEHSPGTKVKIEVIREGKNFTLEATLGELPEEVSVKPEKKQEESKELTRTWLGITVKETASGTKGVEVAEVEAGSVGELAGIQTGDIILKIDKYDIEGISDFSKAANALKNTKRPILFRIKRGSASLFIAVTPE